MSDGGLRREQRDEPGVGKMKVGAVRTAGNDREWRVAA
jgi:hypothetical protein